MVVKVKYSRAIIVEKKKRHLSFNIFTVALPVHLWDYQFFLSFTRYSISVPYRLCSKGALVCIPVVLFVIPFVPSYPQESSRKLIGYK